jgi:hypothetical protein
LERGTGGDDVEELPGWTCLAEQVSYANSWEKSGALIDGSLSDCNVTKEREGGGASLTMNSGALSTITALVCTVLALTLSVLLHR